MTCPPHSSSPSKMKWTLSGGRRFGVERRLVGLEQAEDLALVVGGAARVEPAVAHGGLERRPDPLVERVGRLDVVVAVDQQGGPAGHVAGSPPRPPDGPGPR